MDFISVLPNIYIITVIMLKINNSVLKGIGTLKKAGA
jgi:hypothetical protein